jgi:hypothetical protein
MEGGDVMNVLDRYFTLSDQALTDEWALKELVTLFAEEAKIIPARDRSVEGRLAIEEFFRDFFRRNQVTHHLWNTEPIEQGFQAQWVVIGKRTSGDHFTFKGTDKAIIDEQGKITSLHVQFG